MTMGKKLDPKAAKKVMLNAGLKPLEPFTNTSSKWKCLHLTCGKVVYPRYMDVARSDRKKSSGCVSCGRLKAASATKVSEEMAVKVMKKAGYQPLEPYSGSKNKWKCLCLTCKNVIYPKYNSIKSGYKGCQTCYRVNIGNAKRLSITKVMSFMQSKNLKPLEPYKSSNSPWKCQCLKCKMIINPTYSNLKFTKNPCIYCAHRKIDEKYAIKIMKENGLIPLEQFKTANKQWKCKCTKCKKISSPSYSHVLDGHGCIHCGVIRRSEKALIPQKVAVAIMKKAKLQPLEPYRGGNRKWKCKCLKCKRIVYPWLNSIKNNNQGGCIYCAELGFNYKKSAILYIIFHQELYSIKVGITNGDSKPDRLDKHKRQGWEVHKTYSFKTGMSAFKTEQKVLNWMRKDMQFGMHLSSDLMPQAGHTETVSADLITVIDIQNKVEELIKK